MDRLFHERLQILDWQGTEAVLRLDKPGLLSRDLVMSPQGENTIAARLPVRGRLDDRHFGRFSLAANQTLPLNAMVPLSWLQRQTQFKIGACTADPYTMYL